MTQPTSHTSVRTSVLPSEFAPAPSTLTNSSASFARAEVASTSVTPRSPGVWLTWSPRSTLSRLSQASHESPSTTRRYTHGRRVQLARGSTYHIDTAMITPFSSNAGLISTASARPCFMAKREEKRKFDRYPRINLAPFHPCDQQTTWLPRTKVHQIPIQRYGPSTNSHPRRLGSDSDHPAQQQLQWRFFSSPLHTRSTIVCCVVSGSSHVLVLFSGSSAAIATELLLQRPPGDRKRSPPVASSVCTAPLTDSTGSAGFQQTPSSGSAGGLAPLGQPLPRSQTGGAASSSLLSQSWLCRFVRLAHSSLHALHTVGG